MNYLERGAQLVPLVACLVIYSYAPAHAQGQAGRAAEDGHSLTVTASSFASYTTNQLSDIARNNLALPNIDSATGVLRGRDHENAGVYSGFNGNLNYGYVKQGNRGSFLAGARTSGSYLPDLNINALQHMANIDVMKSLGGRTTVQFTQNARASDHFRLVLFPDLASNDPAAVLDLSDDYAVIQAKTYSFQTSTRLTRTITKQSSIGVDYGFRRVESPQGDFDFRSHQAGASYQFQLTRYATLRASYGYRQIPQFLQSEDDKPFETHNVNAGIDYNRAFSLSGRRTRLTFTTGSAFVAAGREEQRGDEIISSRALRPFVQGTVTLSRNLFRSWDAHASYRRLVHFFEGLKEPLFTDGVSAGVSGQLGPHLTANATISHLFEATGMRGSNGNSYGSKMAAVQFAHPLLHVMDVFAHYFYFRQTLGDELALPDGFPRRVNRHSLRVGVALRLSLLP